MFSAWDCVKRYCSSASRPVKPLPVGLRRLGSTARSRSLTSSSTKRRLRIGSVLIAAQLAQLLDRRARLADGDAAGLRRLAEPAHRRPRGVRERAQALEQRREVRRGQAQVGERGGLQGGGGAEVGERRAQLAQEARQALDGRGELVVALRGGRRRVAGLLDEARDVAAVGGEVDEHAVGVAGELPAACGGWRARISSTRSVSRSAGTPRRIVACRSSPRAATPMPSSDRISPKRSRAGRRRMSSTRSGGIVPAVCSTGIVFGRGLGRLARLAVQVVLADQRLRLDLAAHVGAKAREVRARDGDRRQRAGRRALHVELLHAADDDARRAQVRALGEAEGVVEHDGVALLVARRRRRSRRAPPRAASSDDQRADDATERADLMGRSASGVRSQLKSADGT